MKIIWIVQIYKFFMKIWSVQWSLQFKQLQIPPPPPTWPKKKIQGFNRIWTHGLNLRLVLQCSTKKLKKIAHISVVWACVFLSFLLVCFLQGDGPIRLEVLRGCLGNNKLLASKNDIAKGQTRAPWDHHLDPKVDCGASCVVACERQTFLLVHHRWGMFREEEHLRLSDRNSILMT